MAKSPGMAKLLFATMDLIADDGTVDGYEVSSLVDRALEKIRFEATCGLHGDHYLLCEKRHNCARSNAFIDVQSVCGILEGLVSGAVHDAGSND